MITLTLDSLNTVVGTPDNIASKYYWNVRISFNVEYFCDEYKETKTGKAPELQFNIKGQLPTIGKLEKQIMDHINRFIAKRYKFFPRTKAINITYKIFTLKPD
jgi:hypothetical protein